MGAARVKPSQILVYMLVEYDERETRADVFRRLEIMREYRLRPFPMVYAVSARASGTP